MKYVLTILAFSMLTATAFARDTYVNGYVRKDGTYVQPHYRSNANSNPYDNYSTKGNTNPYTGSQGTKTYDNYNQYQNNNQYSNKKKGW